MYASRMRGEQLAAGLVGEVIADEPCWLPECGDGGEVVVDWFFEAGHRCPLCGLFLVLTVQDLILVEHLFFCLLYSFLCVEPVVEVAGYVLG